MPIVKSRSKFKPAPTPPLVVVPKVYTTGQVASLLGHSARKAAKLIDSGVILSYRLPGGDARRVPHASLAAYLATQVEFLGLLRAGEVGPQPQPESLVRLIADASEIVGV